LISDPAENKATHEVAFCFLLNQLLGREAWARQRLAPFAGESVELRAPPLPAVRFGIVEGGRVEAGAKAPSLTVTLKPGAPAALARGEEHFMREVEVSGNARLAAEVLALARHLRWDFTEDLSRVIGDVAAHRVGEAARAFVAWQADAAQRLAEALAGYATEEKHVLVRRAELRALAGGIAGLRDAVERLAKRVERL
jgi:ubiquinone biosynthesis protein UbiJ